MYDGIKIDCKINHPAQWSKTLGLVGRYSENTGEVLPLPSECSRNSCNFIKIPTAAGTKYTFQGSLHRFHNNGGENDNDFTIAQVKHTLKQLEHDYSINPARSKIINFEFGVNINLPDGLDAQAFNKYLVSAQFKAFEKLNPKRPAIGYIAEFNEFSIKIYDKGYHARNGATDLVRVEIKVNRTRWLDQFGFIKGNDLFLNDLLKPVNIKILGDILQSKIRSLILTPRVIDIAKLTPKQVQTFYECRDARSWEEWNSRQRERKRKQLAAIFKKVNQADPVDELARLVAEKWSDVTTEIEPRPEAKKPVKMVIISTIIVNGIRAFLNLFKKHEQMETKPLFIIPATNWQPLPRGEPPDLLIGVNRWIDIRARSDPVQLGNNNNQLGSNYPKLVLKK